jgi:lysine 6-dehydrogenase
MQKPYAPCSAPLPGVPPRGTHIHGMQSVIVLGAGRVGGAMARDLAADPGLDVTAVDSDADALRRLQATEQGARLRVLTADIADANQLRRVVRGQDLALSAVPGPMGFETLRHLLEAGIHAVDISFFEEDAFELDELARHRGLVAIVDAGLAPGLSNLILGHHEARLTETRSFLCLVGGIPASPSPPWGYKAPFSPIDVIAEYTRPARIRRDGRELALPALAEPELIDLPGVGTVEAFLTDGLRTLLRTSRAPDLVEKTLRWPGHADRIVLLRDSGFLDPAPRLVNGRPVPPLDVTLALLFEAWRYAPGEADLTVLRIVIDGHDRDRPVRHEYGLVDRHDPVTGVSAMARTTGYTATALARLVLDGRWRAPGIAPPETIGAANGTLAHVIDYLGARGVELRASLPSAPSGGS